MFADSLSIPWLLAAWALYLPVLARAVLRAPWRDLAERGRLHAFLGACVSLMVLWRIEAGISPGLGFHYLGATVLTLMFGWRLALIALAAVLAGVTAAGDGIWSAFAANAVVDGLVPVLVSHGIYRLVDRRLPNHLFVYIFLCAFLGAGLALAASNAATAGVLAISGAYTFEHIAYEFLPYFPLMMFPEAWISGAVIVVLIALRPQWVATFDDARYLRQR